MPARRERAPRCVYPQSHALAGDVWGALAEVAAAQSSAASVFLPTAPGMNEGGEDHYQGMARSQRLSDGSVHLFLAHSDVDSKHGSLVVYRYPETEGEHLVATAPPTYATLEQHLVLQHEQHPSDVAFLPDVNGHDSGYLFVTLEYDQRVVAVYAWSPERGLVSAGDVFAGFPKGGPQFVFVDRVGEEFHLGVASEHWGWGELFRADAARLFPKCAPGQLDVQAFRPAGMFPFPVVGGACQTKLVRDRAGDWFLLAYRADPNDKENGTDYVDVHGVRFDPFVISYRLRDPVHVSFPAGDTGFASTGTHWVEESGRLLVSSSYRWDRYTFSQEPPYFVCRVDELASS